MYTHLCSLTLIWLVAIAKLDVYSLVKNNYSIKILSTKYVAQQQPFCDRYYLFRLYKLSSYEILLKSKHGWCRMPQENFWSIRVLWVRNLSCCSFSKEKKHWNFLPNLSILKLFLEKIKNPLAARKGTLWKQPARNVTSSLNHWQEESTFTQILKNKTFIFLYYSYTIVVKEPSLYMTARSLFLALSSKSSEAVNVTNFFDGGGRESERVRNRNSIDLQWSFSAFDLLLLTVKFW